MAGPANLIKAQILVNLNALVSAGTLRQVIERDINTNILDEDSLISAYPCAFLGSSSMNPTNWEYQQTNKRTYEFDLLFVQLQDNLTSQGDIEDLRDAVSLQFDNDVTLSGTAVAGVEAVFSDRAFYTSKGKNYVLFSVRIKATTLIALTYNF